MKKPVQAALSVVVNALAGCAAPATVVLTGRSATIRTSSPQAQDRQAAEIKAQGICGQVGKRAQYTSTNYVHDLNIQHLFLCIQTHFQANLH